MSSKKKTPTKVEVRDVAQNEVVKARVGEVTVESAIRSVGATSASVGKLLAGAIEKVQTELQVLEDVKKVVALTQADLETLHGKDALLRSIEEIQVARDEMNAQLERDREALVAEFELEKANYKRQSDENAAQSDFQLNQQKLAAQATFEAERHQTLVQERDRKEAVERGFAARDAELKARETELATLRTQVAAFPQQLKTEVAAAAGAAGSAVKRDLEHQMEMLQKDAAGAQVLANLRVATLTEQVAALQQQVTAANARVEAANAKVAEIATKALDSASGQRTLTEMQQFANKDGSNGASRKT